MYDDDNDAEQESGGRRLRINGDGCIFELDVFLLKTKPKVVVKLQTYEGIINRKMAYVMVRGKEMLADIITGTIYDKKTGRCNSNNLYIINLEKIK